MRCGLPQRDTGEGCWRDIGVTVWWHLITRHLITRQLITDI